MANRRVLVQWIGHSDLQWLASTLGGAQRAALLAEINRDDVALTGPTSTLLKNESFDDVLLLSNYKKKWNDIFVKALGDANDKTRRFSFWPNCSIHNSSPFETFLARKRSLSNMKHRSIYASQEPALATKN